MRLTHRHLRWQKDLQLDQVLAAEVVSSEEIKLESLRVVVVDKVFHLVDELLIRDAADKLVYLLRTHLKPVVRNVGGDENAAHRVGPPELARETHEADGEKCNEIRKDIISVVKRERGHSVRKMRLSLAVDPECGLDDNDTGDDCKRGRVNCDAIDIVLDEAFVKSLARTHNQLKRGKHHEGGTENDANGLESALTSRIERIILLRLLALIRDVNDELDEEVKERIDDRGGDGERSGDGKCDDLGNEQENIHSKREIDDPIHHWRILRVVVLMAAEVREELVLDFVADVGLIRRLGRFGRASGAAYFAAIAAAAMRAAARARTRGQIGVVVDSDKFERVNGAIRVGLCGVGIGIRFGVGRQ